MPKQNTHEQTTQRIEASIINGTQALFGNTIREYQRACEEPEITMLRQNDLEFRDALNDCNNGVASLLTYAVARSGVTHFVAGYIASGMEMGKQFADTYWYGTKAIENDIEEISDTEESFSETTELSQEESSSEVIAGLQQEPLPEVQEQAPESEVVEPQEEPLPEVQEQAPEPITEENWQYISALIGIGILSGEAADNMPTKHRHYDDFHGAYEAALTDIIAPAVTQIIAEPNTGKEHFENAMKHLSLKIAEMEASHKYDYGFTQNVINPIKRLINQIMMKFNIKPAPLHIFFSREHRSFSQEIALNSRKLISANC